MRTQLLIFALCITLLTVLGAPCWGLDYEAKPVMWALQAPIRAVGALSGAVVGGSVSGPIDGCYHGFLKGSRHFAGKFGDDKSPECLAGGVVVGGPPGAVVGTAYGIQHGFFHGLKEGWDKPFSRWSYITSEEEKQ